MDQIQHIDIPTSGGAVAVITAVLTALLGAAFRTWLKDRQERKDRDKQILIQCCRQAYNSVQNRIKKEGKEAVGDKVEAGLIALDRFLTLRRGHAANLEEKEMARMQFDALHGEFCPGGTGTPPKGTPIE